MTTDYTPGSAGYVAPFFPEEARTLVFEHVKALLEPTDKHVEFTLESVYVVSFTYILGNWKALLSTTLPDQMYYEVTRDGLQRATYITSYKQWNNVTILDEDPR